MESRRWRLVQEFSPVRLAWHYYEYSLAAFALVIALIASGCAWTYYREPVVEVPTKLGADSPAELFLAELRVAIPEAKRLIGAEQLYGSLGPVSAAVSFSTPMADEWRTLIESLPPIGEIKTGDVLSAIVGLFGRLRRRIELHVGGSVEDVTAFATLRRGAQILATWRIAADEDGPLDVRRAADQLAYNLLWELRR
jgi:hypothetical protein